MSEQDAAIDVSYEDDEDHVKTHNAQGTKQSRKSFSRLQSQFSQAAAAMAKDGTQMMSKRELMKANMKIALIDNHQPEKAPRRKILRQPSGKKSPESEDSSAEKEIHKLSKKDKHHSSNSSSSSNNNHNTQTITPQVTTIKPFTSAQVIGSEKNDAAVPQITRTNSYSSTPAQLTTNANAQNSPMGMTATPAPAINQGNGYGLIVLEDDSEVSVSCEELQVEEYMKGNAISKTSDHANKKSIVEENPKNTVNSRQSGTSRGRLKKKHQQKKQLLQQRHQIDDHPSTSSSFSHLPLEPNSASSNIEVISTTNEGVKQQQKSNNSSAANRSNHNNNNNSSASTANMTSTNNSISTTVVTPTPSAAVVSIIPRKSSVVVTLPQSITPPTVVVPHSPIQQQQQSAAAAAPMTPSNSADSSKSNNNNNSRNHAPSNGNIIQLHRKSIDDGGLVSVRSIPATFTQSLTKDGLGSADSAVNTATPSNGPIQIKTPHSLHHGVTTITTPTLTPIAHSTISMFQGLNSTTNGTATPTNIALPTPLSSSHNMIQIPLRSSSPPEDTTPHNHHNEKQSKKKKKAKLAMKEEAKYVHNLCETAAAAGGSNHYTSELAHHGSSHQAISEGNLINQKSIFTQNIPIVPLENSAAAAQLSPVLPINNTMSTSLRKNDSEYINRLKAGPVNKKLYDDQSNLFLRLNDYQENLRRDREMQLEKYTDELLLLNNSTANESMITSFPTGLQVFPTNNIVTDKNGLTNQVPLLFKASAVKDTLLTSTSRRSSGASGVEVGEVKCDNNNNEQSEIAPKSRVKSIDSTALMEKSMILYDTITKKFKNSQQQPSSPSFTQPFSQLHSDFSKTYLTPSYFQSVLASYSIPSQLHNTTTDGDSKKKEIEIEQ